LSDGEAMCGDSKRLRDGSQAEEHAVDPSLGLSRDEGCNLRLRASEGGRRDLARARSRQSSLNSTEIDRR